MTTMTPVMITAVTNTAGAGVATVTTDTGRAYRGLIRGIYIDYDGAAPATTDITITAKTSGAPILTVSNANTDGWFAPTLVGVTVANAAYTTPAPVPLPVADTIQVVVAQANNSQTFKVLVLVEEMTG